MSKFGGISEDEYERRKSRFGGTPLNEIPVEEPAEEEPPRQGGLDRARGALEQFNEGAWLGFGDELAAAGRTVLDPFIGLAAGEEDPFQSWSLDRIGDTYEMYRDDQRGVGEQFREENPGTALALSVAGGFASPANLVAPGAGATRTVVAPIVRGAAEGAVAGYGASENEDYGGQLWDAAKGAMFGGGTAGLFTGVQQAGRTIAKERRTPEQMYRQMDGETVQVPLHMQDTEDRLSSFYRNTVGRSLGGKAALKEQEKPFIEAAQARVDEALGQEKAAKEGLKRAREAIDDDVTQATRNLEDELAVSTAAAKEAEEATTREAKRAAEQATESAREQLRQRTAMEAMPEAGREMFADVDMSDPVAVNNALKSFWGNQAFQEVKGRQFQWEGDVDKGLAKSIRTAISEDPELALTAQGRLGQIAGLIDRLKRAGMSTRTDMAPEDFIEEMIQSTQISGIDGEALMELRNVFAREANKSKSRSARFITREIDDLIRSQLDDADVASFDDQLDRYTTFLAHDRAVSGNKAAMRGGRFTENELMAAGKPFEGMGSSNRPRPMRDEAMQAGQAVEAAKKAAKEAAEEAKVARARAGTEAAQAKRAGGREIADQKKSALRQAVRAADEQVEQLQIPLRKQELKDVQAKALPKNTSPLSELLTTAFLGSMIGGPLAGTIGGVAAGAGVGKALSTQGMQRALTGNTWMQNAMRGLDSERARKIAEQIRRNAARQAALGVE